MDAAQIKRVTATGDVTTATSYLYSVSVTASVTDAASVTVRAGGASGTVVQTVKVATGLTESVCLGAAVACPGGIHVTLTGTTPEATLVYA